MNLEVEERRTYTPEEAARVLGVAQDAVYRALKKGGTLHPIAIRMGGRWLIPRAALMRLLGEQVEDIPASK